jgi:hypothetical protein
VEILLEAAGIVFLLGIVGGSVNALMPGITSSEPQSDAGPRVGVLNVLGNALIGGAAALISWGMHGPVSAMVILSVPAADSASQPGNPTARATPQPVLTVVGACSALLMGIGGARWISSEVARVQLREAGRLAAMSNPNQHLATMIATAPPAAALDAAIAERRAAQQP